MSSLGRLAHYAVRAPDLAASRRFYVELLGLREGYRPPFAFPGAWLYLGDGEAEFGVVHLIGEGEGRDAYLGARSATGGGAIDHIAFLASGWREMRARCERLGARYEERRVPDLGLRQVFLTDPTGVVIELNYPAQEPDI
jgi:catechol 2,3-dioxygenase-like lactoylglutathione lyase family enzyme